MKTNNRNPDSKHTQALRFFSFATPCLFATNFLAHVLAYGFSENLFRADIAAFLIGCWLSRFFHRRSKNLGAGIGILNVDEATPPTDQVMYEKLAMVISVVLLLSAIILPVVKGYPLAIPPAL